MLIRLANEGFSQNGTTFYSFEWTMMCYLISFSINVRLIFSGIVLWVKISVKSFNVFFQSKRLTFENFWSVEAVEDCVEHDLGIVAVRVELRAEAVGVRNDTGVLSDDGVGSCLSDVQSSLSCPGPVLEVCLVAEGLVVNGRRVQACWNVLEF